MPAAFAILGHEGDFQIGHFFQVFGHLFGELYTQRDPADHHGCLDRYHHQLVSLAFHDLDPAGHAVFAGGLHQIGKRVQTIARHTHIIGRHTALQITEQHQLGPQTVGMVLQCRQHGGAVGRGQCLAESKIPYQHLCGLNQQLAVLLQQAVEHALPGFQLLLGLLFENTQVGRTDHKKRHPQHHRQQGGKQQGYPETQSFGQAHINPLAGASLACSM